MAWNAVPRAVGPVATGLRLFCAPSSRRSSRTWQCVRSAAPSMEEAPSGTRNLASLDNSTEVDDEEWCREEWAQGGAWVAMNSAVVVPEEQPGPLSLVARHLTRDSPHVVLVAGPRASSLASSLGESLAWPIVRGTDGAAVAEGDAPSSGVLEAALSLVRRRRSVVVDADMSMPDLFRRCVRMAGSLQCRVVVLEAESASSDEDTEPTGGQGGRPWTMDEPLLVRLPNIEGIEEVVRRSLTGSTDLTDGPGSDSWRSHMELGWYVTVPAGLGTEDAVELAADAMWDIASWLGSGASL